MHHDREGNEDNPARKGGPKVTEGGSPLDGLLEDPTPDDHTLGSTDKPLWDETRHKHSPAPESEPPPI